MSRIIITKFSSRALGAFLCLIGVGMLAIVSWKIWPSASASTNMFNSLWSAVLAEQIEIPSMITFKAIYLVIMGVFFLGLGVVAYALGRQVFYGAGSPALLKCPYCNNTWQVRRAKAYAECPHCRKFVKPQVLRRID